MSFAKLHGSILDSSIWDAEDHVRLVWITMLAMKDQDGIVEAAVPGLARRARVPLEKTEDALVKLSSPDRYSRTPDYEGRRIESVPGGWLILNHEEYREKDNLAERRAKDAARAQRKRQRIRDAASRDASGASRDGHVTVRNVRTSDTETDIPEESASDSAFFGPSSPELPEQGEPPVDRVQASVVRPSLGEPRSARGDTPGDPRSEQRSRLLRVLVPLHVEIFNRVREHLGSQVPRMAVIGDPAERALRALLVAQVDLDGFEEVARHVLAVREDEAIRKNSVKFLGQSVWNPDAFGIAKTMEVGEERRGDAGPLAQRGQLDVLDDIERELAEKRRA